MQRTQQDFTKVAYVVKRYPRFSETFVVNEILAHEAAGLPIEIFSLRPPSDTHFQDIISRVRAPLQYLSSGRLKAEELWSALRETRELVPDLGQTLDDFLVEDRLDAYCGIRLAKHVLQNGISHIHAHFASSAATVARIASKITGIPYSITAHAKDIFHESVDEAHLRQKLRDAETVFTVSDFNVRYLYRKLDCPANSIKLLYNGLHLREFPYESPRLRPPQLIAVGRFVEKKGLPDLLDACAILKSQGIDFCCKLVGSGEQEALLEKQITSLGIQDRVRLVGPQPQKVVKQLVQSSAIMIAPCVAGNDGNRDGLPTVLLEAMALGTPCISTDVTGIPEAIIDGQTGSIVPQRNPIELAKAIQLYLNNSQLRDQISCAARKLVEQRFDIVQNSAVQRRYFGATASSVPEKPTTAKSNSQLEYSAAKA